MNVLVTGALGNIGGSVVAALLERGEDNVCAFDVAEDGADALPPGVELRIGDVADREQVAAAVRGRDAIVHLAAILPPAADEDPSLAERVNVHGTRALLAAAAREPLPPRLVFSSSFAVFGPTRDLAPPRRADDPTVATDPYSRHKIQAEEAIRGSALDWTILRFCDVPPREPRRPHPLLFQIPLDTRFETLHPADAATAIVAALHCDAASRRVLLVGGGARCQMLYRDYLFGFLDALGVGALPEDAFATEPHYGDWLDSAESERLLHYQRHGFDDIVRDVVAGIGDDVVDLLRMVGPLAQEYLLSMSPYVRRRPSSSRSG